jgi:hypothetical protein
MKGPLSSDKLFFISALVFTVSFVIYTILNYAWPLPPLTPDQAMQVPQVANVLGQLTWVLPIVGFATFVLGLLASRK